MKRFDLVWVVLLFMQACGARHSLTEVPCRPTGATTGAKLSCYDFEVPARHGTAAPMQGRGNPTPAITLHAYVATSAGSTLPPIDYILGGPGESLADAGTAADLRRLADLHRRTVFALELRGAQLGSPFLRCTLQDAASSATTKSPSAFQACVSQWRQQNIDLGAFNTYEAAADHVAFLSALGFKKAVLWGTSYGTTLAGAIVARAPDLIDRLIFDSVYPFGDVYRFVDVVSAKPRVYADTFTDIDFRCSQNSSCAALAPGLNSKHEYEAALDRFATSPLLLSPGFSLTAAQYAAETRQLWYSSDATRLIPIALAYFDRTNSLPTAFGLLGRGSPAAGLERLQTIASSAYEKASLTDGINTLFECNDQFAYWQQNEVQARIDAAPLAARADMTQTVAAFTALCTGLPKPTAPQSEVVKAPSSNLPTLIYSGLLDPATPRELLAPFSQAFANATVAKFACGGHALSEASPCAEAIRTSFLRGPAASVDVSCAADCPPFQL